MRTYSEMKFCLYTFILPSISSFFLVILPSYYVRVLTYLSHFPFDRNLCLSDWSRRRGFSDAASLIAWAGLVWRELQLLVGQVSFCSRNVCCSCGTVTVTCWITMHVEECVTEHVCALPPNVQVLIVAWWLWPMYGDHRLRLVRPIARLAGMYTPLSQTMKFRVPFL